MPHYREATYLCGAMSAEKAYGDIVQQFQGTRETIDKSRRRILIPMILAEMRRRDRLKLAQQPTEQLEAVTK